MRRGREPARRVPTLEEAWATHGSRLRELARRWLGDDRVAVEAACYAVMVRAGEELLAAMSAPRTDAELWSSLERAADPVCREIQDAGVDPAWVSDRPLPEALPARLRTLLQLRAQREAAELTLEAEGASGPIGEAILRSRRKLREEVERHIPGLAGLAPVVRLIRRAAEDTGRALRDAGRRAGTTVSPVVQSVNRMGGLVTGSSGLNEVAAVVTAAIVLGAAVPGHPGTPAGPSPELALVGLAQPVGATLGPWGAEAAPGEPAPPAIGAGGKAPAPPTDGVGRVSTTEPASPVQPAALPSAPSPQVDADPEALAEHPVREQRYEDRGAYETAEAPIGADLDGGDDEDVSVTPPQVGVTCPEPEERGLVTGVVCPIAEATVPSS